MSHTYKNTILLLAAALLTWSASASAQTPVIWSVSPQPTSAGTATSLITITGQNIGNASDVVYFPGNPPQGVTPSSWSPGQLTAMVPEDTWSGTFAVLVGTQTAESELVVSFCSDDTRWHGLPMHWSLNQNGAPGVPIAMVTSALNGAFHTWECASGFDHTYDGLTSRTGSAVSDGYNVQYWKSTPWAEPSMIALATMWYNVTTGEILEADIAYNAADFSWSRGGSATTMDIQHIATHESGHVLGLLDIYGYPDTEKTMYGIQEYDTTHARSLHEHDAQGAEYLYPHAGRGNNREATPTGWWGPIVPRDAADATDSWAPLPSTLPGYVEIYTNFSETNDGLDCLAPGAQKYLYLDGVTFNNGGWNGPLPPGGFYNLKNQPVTVPGGRHTLRVDHDKDNELVESNENDNSFEAQFAWSPFGLADQHPEVRPAPPVAGTLTHPNCDGFMFTGNWWGAVASTPTHASDDYDLYLFDNYSSSTASYQTWLVQSQYMSGRTDFVVVNGNIAGENSTRTAGAVGYTVAQESEVVIQQSNQVGPTYYPGGGAGDSATTGERLLVLNQNIKIHEFFLSAPNLTYEFQLKNMSGGADLDLAVLASDLAYQSPSNAVALGQDAGPGLDESVLYEPVTEGWYGVAVYKQGSADLPLESHYELICRVAPPNLDATDIPGGHYGPVVARNTTGASTGNAHMTATLDGNSPTTWFSFSVEQEGPNDSSQWLTNMILDSEVVLESVWSGEPVPVTSVQWFDRGPFEVRGGRHGITLHADVTEAIGEPNEADNYYLTQFVWSPLVTGLASPTLRDAPPATGPHSYANCDGYTFTRDMAAAWVAGLAPINQDDDYDLYVYNSYSGANSGFDSYMGVSVQTSGWTDFVVGHYQSAPVDVLAGAVEFDSPAGDMFTFQANDAISRQGDLEGTFLYQGMGPFHIVDVYEAFLLTGQRVLFKLEKLVGASDLKVHVFPGASGGVHTNTDIHDISTTFVGGEEWLVFQADMDGWYPIVVAREDYRGLEDYLEYNLTWGPTQITGVADPITAPTKLMFMAPAPNPSSSGSSFAFALPHEGKVRVDVFDLRGHRVMTLADRQYPAGRHEVRWTGRDDRGRLAATGVYYARLQFAGQALTRRMTVLR